MASNNSGALRGIFRIGLAALVGSLLGGVVRAFLPGEREEPREESRNEGLGLSDPKFMGDFKREPEPAAPGQAKEEPHPTGWMMKGDRVIVMLSDGTKRVADRRWPSELSDPVEVVTSSHVVLDGKRLWIKAKARGQASGVVESIAEVKEIGGAVTLKGRDSTAPSLLE